MDPVSTPWYKYFSSWLWILGGLFVVFLEYKLIIDPLWIDEVGRNTAGIDPSDLAGSSTQPEITINDNRGISTRDQ